jgi:hypothetical protein
MVRPASNKLRAMMTRVVRNARVPFYLYNQRNNYGLSPTRILSAAMKVCPPFGKAAEEGHSFAYAGSPVWADDMFRFLEQQLHRAGEARLALWSKNCFASHERSRGESPFPPTRLDL